MEIERVPLGQSASEKRRAARYRWLNMPAGLTPELAAQFKLGVHSGKTVRDMTTAGGPNYICSEDRFQKHCQMHSDWWGAEERRLNIANASAKKSVNSWQRLKTHCLRGHDLAVHGKFFTDKQGLISRRCYACVHVHQRGSGIIRAEAVAKVKEHLKAGGKIATIFNSGLMRAPVWNLLRMRDPSITALVEDTKPLRFFRGCRGGVSHLPKPRLPRLARPAIIRGPALTGIIAGRPDPLFDAVNAAVGFRLDRDIRMEAIARTILDHLEGCIDDAGIVEAARKHVASLYREKNYTRSVDEPRFRDGAGGAWVEALSEGIW